MEYLLLVLISAGLSIIGTVLWQYFVADEKVSVKTILKEVKKIKYIFFIGSFFTLTAISFFLLLFYKFEMIFIIKRILILSLLLPLSFIDAKKFIIPNKILLVAIVYRILLVIFEIFLSNQLKVSIVSEVIALLSLTLIFCLLRLLVRGGIGYGDIKLFGVMGLFFGLKGGVTTVFVSLVVSFVFSIFLLVTKKKDKKSQIAFAPSITVGSILSVIFLGA